MLLSGRYMFHDYHKLVKMCLSIQVLLDRSLNLIKKVSMIVSHTCLLIRNALELVAMENQKCNKTKIRNIIKQ